MNPLRESQSFVQGEDNVDLQNEEGREEMEGGNFPSQSLGFMRFPVVARRQVDVEGRHGRGKRRRSRS